MRSIRCGANQLVHLLLLPGRVLFQRGLDRCLYTPSFPQKGAISSCCRPAVQLPAASTCGRSRLAIAAAAAVGGGKGKKAKFSKQHPSKQKLKKKFKSKDMQQQQQQQQQQGAAGQKDRTQQKGQQKPGQAPQRPSGQASQQAKQQQQHAKGQQGAGPSPAGGQPSKQQPARPKSKKPKPRPVPQLTKPQPLLQQPAARTEVDITAAAAAAASAAAAAAISAAQQHVPQHRQQQQQQQQQQASSSSSSSGGGSRSLPPLPSRVGSITYTLDKEHRDAYRAAGVVVYDFVGPQQEPRLLLVREKKGVWSLPAGKVERTADGFGSPDATAARELEEESHGLIAAADSRAVLPHCPVLYCSASKMVVYFMRCAGGQQLPELLERRMAAGLKHPKAEGVDMLAWVTLEQLQRGVRGPDSRTRGNKSRQPGGPAAAAAAATAAAAEGEGEGEAEEAEAEEGEAAAEQEGEAEQAAAADTQEAIQVAAGDLPLPDLASLQLGDGSKQQQQVEGVSAGRLLLRVPLLSVKHRVVSWLSTLSKGQAPVLGLEVVQQQQQDKVQEQQEKVQQEQGQRQPQDTEGGQQQQQQDLQVPTVRPLALSGRWAGHTLSVQGSAEPASWLSSSSSGGGQAFLSAGSNGGGGSAGGAAAGVPPGLGADGGAARQQPWAIGVWSGQHGRQQQQHQQHQQ